MKKSITIIILFAVTFGISAQDAHFSQFYASPLLLSPALTGLKNGDFRATANYRQQWGSISEPYRTMSAAVDYNLLRGSIGENMLGVGLILFNDKAGTAALRRTRVAMTAAYSQNIAVEGNYISIGFEAAAVQHGLDREKLLFESQYDGESLNGDLGSGEDISRQSIWHADFTAGVAWSYTPNKYNTMYAGISMAHLNRPNVSFYDGEPDFLEKKLSIYAGGEVRVNGYISLLPRGVMLRQGPHSEINVGMLGKLSIGEPGSDTFFSIGAMYRLKDAVIPMLRFDYGPVGFGISYDVNVSTLVSATASQGGAELSFIYRGVAGDSRARTLPCPKF